MLRPKTFSVIVMPKLFAQLHVASNAVYRAISRIDLSNRLGGMLGRRFRVHRYKLLVDLDQSLIHKVLDRPE